MPRHARPSPVAYVPRGLDSVKCAQIVRLLASGASCVNIAKEVNVSERTVYRIQWNLVAHGSAKAPRYRKLGRPSKLTKADEDALFEYLLHEGWRYQDEMVQWLWHERGVLVSKSTVCRLIKNRTWTRKKLKRISLNRSEALRRAYLDDIRQFTAEDLVFVDESIFNEKTGWRQFCYSPIGTQRPVQANTDRGRTWSICAAMGVNGLLPCTGMKVGYFSAENFIGWLRESFIPAVNLMGGPRIIVMDNVAIHCRDEVREVIEEAGHLLRYLPPYSPDFNPIELMFSVLKAWMKRHWVFLRRSCSTYGEFLALALGESRCDRFAREQFRSSANGAYIEEKELIRFRRFLERYEEDSGLELESST